MNYKKIIKDLKEFNSQLKGQYSDEQNRNYCLQRKIDKLEKEKQELIEYLKEEQDRLARECSHIYEDSLGRTRLVSEDIYNEVSKILSKIEKR